MSSTSSSVTLPQNLPGRTISEALGDTVARLGDQIAIRHIQPTSSSSGEFSTQPYTWNDYNQQCRAFAKALIANKVKTGHVVTIQGSNHPRWIFTNIGTMIAGGVSAGVYSTNSPELSKRIVTDSQAEVAVVEDEDQLQKYQQFASTTLKCIVVWDKLSNPQARDGYSVPVYTWDEFIQQGASVPDAKLHKRIGKQTPNQPCSLIYTSGTTGTPKGAVLTHDNLTWTARKSGEKFSIVASDRGISYLPLSHISAQQVDCVLPVLVGNSTHIAPKDALRGSNLKQHIVNTRPTYFLAVPRVWEKFKESIEAKVKTAPLFKQVLFKSSSFIAKGIVPDYNYLTAKRATTGLTQWEKIRFVVEGFLIGLLEKIIFRPLKEALGLDQCRIFANGAGALNPEVFRFFTGLNISIFDVYGLSETSAPATLPGLLPAPVGSCGQAVPGTEVKILHPDEHGEGEILIKGRNVFMEYLNNETATREALDSNGFFHSGDRGRIDENGNIFVTGRVKELIKTSGGENIPPLRVEQRIKSQLPIVSQAVLIGDGRRFLTCLLTLKTDVDQTGNPTNTLAPEVIEALKGVSSATTLQEASQNPQVQEYLMRGVERANREADSHAQCVQKVCALPEDFSIANGLMTATMKLKRQPIEQKYHELIEKMYA